MEAVLPAITPFFWYFTFAPGILPALRQDTTGFGFGFGFGLGFTSGLGGSGVSSAGGVAGVWSAGGAG